MGIGPVPAGVFEGRLPGSDVPIYFIAERNLFDRPQIYGYWDDVGRFAFFSRAALDLIPALGWRPDIVHAHDWHTAPAVTWLATAGQADDRYRGIPFAVYDPQPGPSGPHVLGHFQLPGTSSPTP